MVVSCYFRIIIALFLTVTIFQSGNLSAQTGGYAGAFLRMGATARGGAMGDAVTSIPADAAAGYYNPAGIPFLKDRIFTASGRILSLDRRMNYVSYAQALRPTAGLGVGWMHASVGGLEGRDRDGVRTGSIDQGEHAFYFSFANRFARLVSIGISGKILYQKLHVLSARNFGWDFGFLVTPRERLNIGGMVQDVNSGYKWNSGKLYDQGTSKKDDFPRIMKFGVSYTFVRIPALVSLEMIRQTDEKAEMRAGAEVPVAGRIFLRGGLRGKDVTAGFGILFKILGRFSRLDYALQDVEFDTELNHLFTWTFMF